ncbi:MAG TPA: glycosyl transferase family 2 [Lachnospiraceae bacterium]|nr:glycosyl transferase family 2 [Lachnospiraceae bacterium]
MKFTGERLLLGKVDKELEIEHINRYIFAKNILSDKNILDSACGSGYGTAILSSNNNNVVGLDISEEAIEYAKENYLNKDINFVVGSIAELPFADNSFDGVVSFETIEHVHGEVQNKFLQEVKRVLKNNGILVISTPNHDVYKIKGENHFHVKEFTFQEFKTFLESNFKQVKLYSQHFEVCNVIVENKLGYAEVDNGFEFEKAEYIIAVCSDFELPEINERIYIRDDGRYNSLLDWAVSNHNTNEKNNKFIAEKLLEIKSLENSTRLKDKETLKLNDDINNKRIEIQENENIICNLQQEIRNKEGHIELLLESERELERIKKSWEWRVFCFFRKGMGIFFPIGSKRRLILKVAVKFLKSPGGLLRKLSIKRIRQFFYYLKREGLSGVSRRVDECLKDSEIKPITLDISQLDNQTKHKKITEYKPIEFLKYSKPEVSIVIPVYNQFEYTYNCLKSIQKNSGKVNYEIIIANDCSTDLTTEIEKVVKNITVVKNEENLRFLKNCNNAAKFAKGKYILFLNNDTQVQANWLEPLIELIERDENIGMVGSKLVYPNGKLQEAGGIFWRDASAWNYGHLSEPNDPEYNYVKEVDYISGAAIMIKSFLWNEIGGFDEIFVPAYYEDSDLAFEVRKRGYKVMYQPLSVVVHFEGISNGIDVNEGQKAYQVTNQKKFYEKWKDILEKENFSNGENLFVAKDRSRFKKHMLVVDHYVPNHDKDAGGKCTFMYIKLFVSLGMKVTFIGDNFFKHEPYTTELNQMGVEVLYGNYYFKNWKKWFRENGNYFDFAYLNRPHIAEKYIDIMRRFSEAKIIYFGHDLHYLREYRQYEIQGDPELLKSSNRWKEKEFELFNKADIIYTVGNYEQEIIKKEFQQKPVRNIPVYIYEGLKEYVNTNFKERKDIMFVGGFGHPPNVDAVLWFAQEILPKVLNEYPDMKWYIVGSKPPENILKLACDNIIVTGFIPDDELDKLYDSCRMAVVPLRVGAGVKGKVVEAVYNRIPLVTTPIGAEGLSLSENAFVITEGSDEMTDAIINLYENFYELEKISDNCKLFIENHFTDKTAKKVVLEDMLL